MSGWDRDADWRLTGQEACLKNVVMVTRRWSRPRPSWDHDHCIFCWRDISDQADDVHEAFTHPTKDRRGHASRVSLGVPRF